MNTLELAKHKEHLLQEIGDTSNIETYDTSWEPKKHKKIDYDKSPQIYFVRFSTGDSEDDINYKVSIHLDKRDTKIKDVGYAWFMNVEFGTERYSATFRDLYTDYTDIVNNDKMYRVMATVLKIVRELIDKFKQDGEYIREIWIDPSKNFEGDTRRTRLYKAYIQRNMPEGSDLYVADDMSYIKLTLP